MSVKRARKSKNEFDESMKQKSVAETVPVGSSYEVVTGYPANGISATRTTSVNPQPASGRVITWDNTKYAIGICYFDEQLQYLQIYDIWVTRSPYMCRDYPYMSITIRKLDNAEVTPSEIGDVRIMLADTALPYEPYGTTIWEPIKAKKYITSKTTEYTGTLPITITADGNALIDYRIYGNTVQTGTPTPESPIMPEGVGERTENLFDYADLEGGFIDISTGENAPNENQKRTRNYITVQANRTYTLSNYEDKCRIHQYSNNSYLGSSLTDVSQYSFTTNSNCTRIRISGNKDNFLETTMLNLGSTALPYEPYGYKLPILSNSTVTNIYLGEAETTRRIKKAVLTGKEKMFHKHDPITNYLYFADKTIFPDSIVFSPVFCNALPTVSRPPMENIGIMADNKPFSSVYFNFGASIMKAQPSGNTVEGLKEYLAAQYAAGTPVTVWYVLAEPETGIVNEPLMKIGDYTDTIDSTQTTAQIPTFSGTTIIDYDGTTKPSQMYIEYNSWSGWEPCTVKRYHNDAWIDAEEYVHHNGTWDEQQ